MDLSVIIITREEELDLPGCLESVKGLGAELVVVDNRSTDRTVEIARAAGARVVAHDFTGYAAQKQHALDQASRRWVLSIDADERVTPELAREIESVCARPQDGGLVGYEIPFSVVYLGRALRFGGLGRERHLRLFRKDAGRFVGGSLHEGVEVRGSVGRLSGKIRHIPYRDIDEHLDKLGRYTSLAARKAFDQGCRAGPLYPLRAAWEFLSRYLLLLGFLDGRPGFVYAVMASFYVWLKLVKLAQLQSAAP